MPLTSPSEGEPAVDQLEQALLAWGRETPLGRRGRVLVAASGGPDSTALVLGLARAAEALGFREVIAGHVDHGLRPDSERDLDALRESCEAIGVRVEAKRVVVEAGGRGIQAAARAARYAALEAMADRLGCWWIATGHTADDQAETLLMRLLRGTSPGGLQGIPGVRGRYIRPLLGVRRALTHAACREAGLSVVADPSNEDPRFSRVKVRDDLIPSLEAEHNPQIVAALVRLAGQAQADESYLAEATQALAARASHPVFGLDAEALLAAHTALRRRVLAGAWIAAEGDPWVVDAEHLHRLEGALDRVKGEACKISLPGRVEASVSMGWLAFCEGGTAPLEPMALPAPGREALFGSWRLSWAAAEASPEARPWMPKVWRVRGPAPGDRWIGGGPLKEQWHTWRIPTHARAGLPLVVADLSGADRVIWAPGAAVRAFLVHEGGRCWQLVAAPIAR